jgi:aspartate kinase
MTAGARTNLVVMKFGGTSVEDAAAIERTASIVRGRRDKGLNAVVVVSAMSKVTDALLAAAAAAGKGDRKGALEISTGLRARHIATAKELLEEPAFREMHLLIDAEFDALDDLLRGIAAVGELTPRTSDLVQSFGERLSSRIVAAAFAQRGLHGAHVDARDVVITDKQHGKAVPQETHIEARLIELLLPIVEAGQTPVMGGFIGSTLEGVTTTLGRGGSDFSAALVGGGLHAGAIEIWTDVNGIMTTDPRIVPEALRVRSISFEEAAELAYFGAKVLHPATIAPAVDRDIPVWVLNSRNAENQGTKITAHGQPCRSPFKCIAAKRKQTIIDIVSSRMLKAHGYLAAVFAILDRHHVVIDMVSTSEVSISLSVDSHYDLAPIVADLQEIATVKLDRDKALICLVGEDIRGRSGIAAQVFNAVKHVNMRMISQGASEINMSFMIDEENVEEAVRSLHKVFFADPDPSVFDVEALAAKA